jgi:hypothetical protein
MLGFALAAKALTVLGPLLVGLIVICDREDERGTERYWQQQMKLWELQRHQEDASDLSSP